MHLRPLALAGALLFSAATASAQFVELLAEAPVTLSATLQTSTVTETETSRSSTLTTTRLSQAQILEELRASGIIDSESIAGWSLVAVRAPDADLVQLSPTFRLYAINRTSNSRVPVPTDKFLSSSVSYAAASKYTERHLGQYVINSRGTVTAYALYQYSPTFSAGGSTFTVESFDSPENLPRVVFNELLLPVMPAGFGSQSNFGASGFAKINYIARDLSDGHEVFTFAITSMSANTLGGFNAAVEGNAAPNGVMNLLVNLGASRLVLAELYPEVSPNPFATEP